MDLHVTSEDDWNYFFSVAGSLSKKDSLNMLADWSIATFKFLFIDIPPDAKVNASEL